MLTISDHHHHQMVSGHDKLELFDAQLDEQTTMMMTMMIMM